MPTVYNMHMVVTDKDSSAMTHRNCIDYQLLDEFLSDRSITFLKLKDVLRLQSGMALTIDDSTAGAYDAAMLCAAHKQHVTVFVNPFYIETGHQYYMHYLSKLVEDLGDEMFLFNNHSYNLAKSNQRKHLRKAVKETLCTLATEDERISCLEQIFGRKVSDIRLPYQLRTMTRGQFQALIANKFVNIEFHGWTHACPTSLSIEDHLEEYKKGQEWFLSNLQKTIRYYALPFGKRDTRLEDLAGFPTIFLEDNSLRPDFSKHHIINRQPIEPVLTQWETRQKPQLECAPVYSQDGTVLVSYPSASQDVAFVIPNTVSVIGSGAFNHCTGLRHVEIPSSVHVIQRNAFAHSGIETVSVPDSVVEIGDLCFYSCKNLKDIKLSESLIDLGDAVFSGCQSLERVVIPRSVQKLGDGLFMGCCSLKTLQLPKQFPKLRDSIFIDCPQLPIIHRYE